MAQDEQQFLWRASMQNYRCFPLCLSQEVCDMLGYRKVLQLDDLAWKQLESLSSKNLHGPRCTDTIESVSASKKETKPGKLECVSPEQLEIPQERDYVSILRNILPRDRGCVSSC